IYPYRYMSMKTDLDKKLSHRLNRIIGQIEALKKKIEAEENSGEEVFAAGDCMQTIYQIKAARNAMKKFAEAYIQTHLAKCFQDGLQRENVENGLKEAVTAAMDL
ncbi:MAG: metal-sensitive transcriptional regulator, partial [Leptospiraceae bacterium]|nr:metal-sensitive transcriptional regulator [Leptospiraceae bacterium]